MFRRPLVVRRGPGLLGAAAVGGVGYLAGRSGANRAAQEQAQEARLAELESEQQVPAAAVPAPAASAAAAEDPAVRHLRQLTELQAAGILTPEEFNQAKARLLA